MIRERLKERPLVSVIVPVYNTQEYLAKCVDSILAQTYDLLEVILVDDGSTDDSGRMCDAYAEKDNRVEVLHKQNGGLMSAWMAGVAIAKGEYFSFVDSDDWVDRGMIEVLVGNSAYAAEIICCNYVIVSQNGRERKVKHAAAPGVYTGRKLEEEILCRILGNGERTVGMSRCMKLISAPLIRNNLHYCNPSIRMGEDVTIILPALLDAERVVILQDAYDYYYLYDEASMVHAYDAGLNENMHLLTEVIRKVLRDKFLQGKLQTLQVKESDLEAMIEKERLMLFQLQIKNELRRPGSDAVSHIRRLCVQENIPQLTQKYPLSVRGMADRLLYGIEKQPTAARIRLAKLLYDTRHAKRTV